MEIFQHMPGCITIAKNFSLEISYRQKNHHALFGGGRRLGNKNVIILLRGASGCHPWILTKGKCFMRITLVNISFTKNFKQLKTFYKTFRISKNLFKCSILQLIWNMLVVLRIFQRMPKLYFRNLPENGELLNKIVLNPEIISEKFEKIVLVNLLKV